MGFSHTACLVIQMFKQFLYVSKKVFRKSGRSRRLDKRFLIYRPVLISR